VIVLVVAALRARPAWLPRIRTVWPELPFEVREIGRNQMNHADVVA
jgi:hypothetical protein